MISVAPSFLPPGIISLGDLSDEIETDGLSRLLAGGEITALFYCSAYGFSAIPKYIWMGRYGQEIYERGYIRADIVSEILNIFTNDQSLTVYIDFQQLQPYLEYPGEIAVEGGTVVAPPEPRPADEAKSMRSRDIQDAVGMLRTARQTKNLTRSEAREFLRQAFPQRHITEKVFRTIEKAVPAKIGRPKKSDS